MIDLYLLKELVSFQKNGTLAKTAQELAVTQPTVTRGMQKLENELGVKLFKREPNRLTLTKAGEFAAKEAQKVIAINESYTQKVQNYALSEDKITVAANAPGPLIILRSLHLKNVHSDPDHNIIKNDFQKLLVDNQYTCLLLNQALFSAKIDSIYLGTENLDVNLNEFTNLASQREVTFSELQKMTFLVFYDIGVWRDVIQKEIPDAKFLYQKDAENFNEIRNNSIFPYFTTNLSQIEPLWHKQIMGDRKRVAIKDKSAHQQFYACFLKENKKRLIPFIQKIQDKWAQVDD